MRWAISWIAVGMLRWPHAEKLSLIALLLGSSRSCRRTMERRFHEFLTPHCSYSVSESPVDPGSKPIMIKRVEDRAQES